MCKNNPPYDPISVANFFIDKATEENEKISPMKLQKLVYFAHGVYLVAKDKPLINVDIEAWTYGPVIPKLYHTFKIYGKDNIEKPWMPKEYYIPKEHKDTLKVLNLVWDAFGHMTAFQLSSLTHIPESPWSKVKEETQPSSILLKNLLSGIAIDDTLIKEYFSTIVKMN